MKQHSKSVLLTKLETLISRLPERHSKLLILEEEVGRQQAGYLGEQTVSYFLREITNKEVTVLHDIRLPAGDYSFFQLDKLVMSQRFCLILEVKNYSGHLLFKGDTRQLIRTVDGKEEVFPDPILQMRRQKKHLIDWLSLQGIYNVPVFTSLVVSNSSARIDISPPNKNYLNQIIHASEISEKIDSLHTSHSKSSLSDPQIQFLSMQIAEQNQPYNPDLFNRYRISPNELLKGVRCPCCGKLAMVREKRKWLCPHCSYWSSNAHLKTLQEYIYLFGPSITTRQCAHFLEIKSLPLAYRLLQAVHHKKIGEKRNRRYYINESNLSCTLESVKKQVERSRNVLEW